MADMTMDEIIREIRQGLSIDSEVDTDGELKISLKMFGETIDSTWIMKYELEEVLANDR